MKHFLIVFISLLIGVWWFYELPALRYQDKILISAEPSQQAIYNEASWIRENVHFFPAARFSLRARVLGKERYYLLREADIAPYDLALGWQEMSKQSIVDASKIEQRDRFFFYQFSSLISPDKAKITATNTHIIAANSSVEETLENIRDGDIIYLSGYLVNIEAPDGWRWRTSLTRNDTMGGACEVIWVEKLEIITHEYRQYLLNE